jgi:hypothetical protein
VFPQGGSTITQQLVRGYFLERLSSTENAAVAQHHGFLPRVLAGFIGAPSTNKLLRKLEEMRLSLWVEKELPLFPSLVVVIPIMVVVMVVPIALRVPTMPVFVPPFVKLAPTIFASLMQLVARMLRLWTVPSVMLSSFVKPVVGPHKAMPARVVIGHSAWSRT